MNMMNQAYIAQLSGTDELWEPLWGLRIRLTEMEQRLLQTSVMRRLHFIHHNGGSYINTQHVDTRLQHSLGVFALVAYYCPDQLERRAAALLHDIGHLPFSHTLEQIEGLDHHQRTRELLYGEEISGILAAYAIDQGQILDLIEGRIPSPLRNKDNRLHLDHLDSWVRSGRTTGLLQSAHALVPRISLVGQNLSTDAETADLLLRLIISEAEFHASAVNIGTTAVLLRLVSMLVKQQAVSLESITAMTDNSLEALLLSSPHTQEEAQRLYYGSHPLRITRDRGEAPADAYRSTLSKLYLSLPLIDQGQVSVESLPSYPLLSGLTTRLGEYYIYWDR